MVKQALKKRSKKTMPKILLSGYYGYDNIGDEAVLQSIIAGIRAEIGEVEIVVLSGNPEKTARLGVRAIPRFDMRMIRKELKGADLFISGGGSLIQDATGFKSPIYYCGVILLARMKRVPVMVYAQGLGPLNTEMSRSLTAYTLKKVQVITWRDQASLDLATSLGIDTPMEVTCDPVLGWDIGKREVKVNEKPRVILALRNWAGMDIDNYASLADSLIKAGWAVSMYPFHEPSDRILAENIVAKMEQRGVKILTTNDPKQAYKLIMGADLVIAMRLHALIMAAGAGVPAIAISYDPKIDAFATRVGQKSIGNVADVKACDIMEVIDRENLAGNMDIYGENAEDFREIAKINLLKVKSLLINIDKK